MFFQILVSPRFNFSVLLDTVGYSLATLQMPILTCSLTEFSPFFFSIHRFIFFPVLKYRYSVVFFLGVLFSSLSQDLGHIHTSVLLTPISIWISLQDFSQIFGMHIPHTLTRSDKTEITFPSEPVTFLTLSTFFAVGPPYTQGQIFGTVFILTSWPPVLIFHNESITKLFLFYLLNILEYVLSMLVLASDPIQEILIFFFNY